MNIRLVPFEAIDRLRYDSCVHYANNGQVYAYSWFLKCVAKRWDVLVEGEYESVLPLPYHPTHEDHLAQPAWAAQLGLFSVHILSAARVQAFLAALPPGPPSAHLRLNEQMAPGPLPGYEQGQDTAHTLFLLDDYEALRAKYSPELLALLERAEGLGVSGQMSAEKLAAFWRQAHQGSEADFHALQRLIYNVQHRGTGFVSTVVDGSGQTLAAAFFIYSHSRLLCLMEADTAKGKALGALPFLFDTLIRSHAGRPLLLDFKGSARGASFGATAVAVPWLRRGSLPKRPWWAFW